MSGRLRSAFSCLGLTMAILLVGCTPPSDENATPTNSIPGNQSTTPSSGGERSGLTKKNEADYQHPVVLIETSLGNITVQLDREKAQLTVGNFLTYVSAKHYDRTIIHQVYKNQGILGGGYGPNLIEKPGRNTVRNEALNGLRNLRGAIAMVRSPDVIDSATCQFIINVADNPILDHKNDSPEGYGYCVFGKVIEGMDVVERIAAVPVHEAPEVESTPNEQIDVKTIRQIR
jgi:cyclophilin family peptidyl-prolyl cis-trans isomerase